MSWLGRLLNGRKLESQLSAELRDHFDRLVADHVRGGNERGRSPAAGARWRSAASNR